MVYEAVLDGARLVARGRLALSTLLQRRHLLEVDLVSLFEATCPKTAPNIQTQPSSVAVISWISAHTGFLQFRSDLIHTFTDTPAS